jgi:predicted transcriptional regulator
MARKARIDYPGTEVARRLGVTQPAVSQAVKRGARIVEETHLKLKED